MKKIIEIFALPILAVSFMTSCGTTTNISKSKETRFEVNEAFEKVYNATQQALLETNNFKLKLVSIDLTFATTTTIETGGGLKLWVISGEYKRAKSNSETATFTFGQDENATKSFVEDKSIKYFKDYLIAVINGTTDIKKLETFGLKEIEVEVEFTITKSSGGNIEMEISPITPSLSINKEREAVHTITLKFKKQ